MRHLGRSGFALCLLLTFATFPLIAQTFGEELRRVIGKPGGYAEVRIWDDGPTDHAPRAATRPESSPQWCLTVTR